MIVTDRYAVYLFVDDTKRQFCLAHLARDLIALSERDGAPARLGRRLGRELGRVFTVLHQPGRDPGNLEALRHDITPVRQTIHDLLATGTRCRDAKTRRFCAGLLAHRPRSGPSPKRPASPRPTTHPSVLCGTPCTGDAPATEPRPTPATGSLSDCSPSARPAASKAGAFTNTSPPRSPPSYTATRSQRSSPPHPDRTP